MRKLLAVTGLAALALLTACSDDGSAVRGDGSSTASGAASASSSCGSGSEPGSGSSAGASGGSGSGSGLGTVDPNCAPKASPEVTAATAKYKAWVLTQVDECITKTKVFTDAVRAGNIEAAKAAYAPSRFPWESIEPVAGLVPDFDGAIDSRVDDFSGPDDPKFTGWHRLELMLWTQNDLSGATPYADALDSELQKLKTTLPTVDFVPASVVPGAADLVEEISKGKIEGEEDRYSHTDWWDIKGNLDGSKQLFGYYQPVLEKSKADYVTSVNAAFAAVEAVVAKYSDGAGGYKGFDTITPEDKLALQSTSADLSEQLSTLSQALGV